MNSKMVTIQWAHRVPISARMQRERSYGAFSISKRFPPSFLLNISWDFCILSRVWRVNRSRTKVNRETVSEANNRLCAARLHTTLNFMLCCAINVSEESWFRSASWIRCGLDQRFFWLHAEGILTLLLKRKALVMLSSGKGCRKKIKQSCHIGLESFSSPKQTGLPTFSFNRGDSAP